MKKTNMAIGQSGGPTSVINMSLYGALEQALKQPEIDTIFGVCNGIEGLLQHRLVRLNDKLDRARQAASQPGAILGASRYELSEQELEKIVSAMETWNIGLFCYIGGNGSSRTVQSLHHYAAATGRDMKFIHIPKTIDNDLFGTDHTPGYGSAAKFVSNVVQWVGADLRSMNTFDQIKIVEMMGRNAGWLAAASALGKRDEHDMPHLVYLPEHYVHLELMLADIERVYKTVGTVLMVVPEFIRTSSSEMLLDQDKASSREFRNGHPGGTSHYLARVISEQLGLKARYDAPGTLYRAAACMTSDIDLKEAYQLGAAAVSHLLLGRSGGMVALHRISHSPYQCEIRWTDLTGISGKERKLPDHYWDPRRHMPSESFKEYLLPLVDHEMPSVLSGL
ncbi:diphosphate--fructose-6-phosphate 1-phosphotransferase [Paenibacillus naphthalenovorans]|uniref:diphosphate--fructose-6-phosphate 1-phosphotransferase n=1 Tax=Paenibacillus naphthalenovorans TaxID=162209 RepID=UPI0010B962CB|nr:diphosphate--fructose-6-phosphate 1-phosphotransferase [Paenibacillus naphthalenovorans]GCL74289.1 pyrophosphate--fructose 6-phosphate 1-phosphotransferase [Paenibacillus naphthalenovorans]